jgi:hypothetical protein
MSPASLSQIRDFFEMTSSEFTAEWKELDEDDRAYFRHAVGEVVNN